MHGDIAVDTETKGLNIFLRDRLCLVQISDGRGDAHLVQFSGQEYRAPNLKKILAGQERQKIFHFARFDVAAIKKYLDVELPNIYCTKIASRLVRTYTDRHGLKELCKELADVDISKQQQTSDWGAETLTKEQLEYAASDVLHLHRLRDRLNVMLEADGRTALAEACFRFIPARAALDLGGWADTDIFAH